MRCDSATDLPLAPLACEPDEPYGPGPDPHEPPDLELPPYTREELSSLFRGGEREADEAEARLVEASRARGGLWLRIGQGLRALKKGRRLQTLAFRFADYAREVGIGRSRAYELVAFAKALETRPVLREAVRSGRVKYRAAQEVMPLAVGEAEGYWVKKAEKETVRALEKEVRRFTDPHADEQWFKLVTAIEPKHRAVLDEAVRIAGRLLPDAGPVGRIEAIAQEYLGEFPDRADEICEGPLTANSWREDLQKLGRIRRTGQRAELDEKRAAAMEGENDRWAHMPEAKDMPAPEVDFVGMTSAKEIDEALRLLVRQDQRWDGIMGHRALALAASGIYLTHGYASFKQYVEERLGLPYRSVSRRVKLEEKIWSSPALQEARRQKLQFEKLWMLSFLPEKEIASMVQRANAMTVIDLRRYLDREEDARMRGQGNVKVLLPRSVAYLSQRPSGRRANAWTGRSRTASAWPSSLPTSCGPTRLSRGAASPIRSEFGSATAASARSRGAAPTRMTRTTFSSGHRAATRRRSGTRRAAASSLTYPLDLGTKAQQDRSFRAGAVRKVEARIVL